MWWKHVRLRLTILYVIIAVGLLFISATGHIRLLGEVDKVFGGFFWAIDTDGQVVVVSTPTQLPPFQVAANSISSSSHIIAANQEQGSSGLSHVYSHARPGDSITYTITDSNNKHTTVTRPAIRFTQDMWWQNYGSALIAGISWLLVGGLLLATAQEWSGAVEGITLLPPAMLLLLYSHWGNVQSANTADPVFQLLWVPSFALLGAAFIHLSLTYRPALLSTPRSPSVAIDVLPYLPLVALLAYEWSSYILLKQHIPTRPNLIISLSYGALGGIISFCIGATSLVKVGRIAPNKYTGSTIPVHIRRRVGDLLTLWIGSVGLGFFFGVLPILLTGQTLLPLPIFYVLVAVYPFILWYAIRTMRLIDKLHITLEQREEALRTQEHTAETLRRTNEDMLQANRELKQATSLLLHADAHLRSILSQHIHDQPKQQALRIRSLLNHWHHKLRVESEHDPTGRVAVQPVLDALSKVRKISEELESDLRGLQLLVEDAYQRRSLGLRLHLEKLIREDLPTLHPESPLKVQSDLWALDALSADLEQTEEGTKVAEAISYTVTQALLNIYNHAGATYASVRTVILNNAIEVYIIDDGRGFDTRRVSPEKTSLFKAQLKAREAGGMIAIQSVLRPQPEHGTTVMLHLPLPYNRESNVQSGPLIESKVQRK